MKVVLALARRPDLWPAARRFVPTGWWRRWPPVPLPSRQYLRFRHETMYGADSRLVPDDLVRYLEWCREMARRAR
ncbi:MAG TPA: hypothetical protein VG435_11625 [Acidimicrobiales bacterium]|jgi:hypothetical protein|nr:hypothetical protein [Acidimicrobiales bacterium]